MPGWEAPALASGCAIPCSPPPRVVRASRPPGGCGFAPCFLCASGCLPPAGPVVTPDFGEVRAAPRGPIWTRLLIQACRHSLYASCDELCSAASSSGGTLAARHTQHAALVRGRAGAALEPDRRRGAMMGWMSWYFNGGIDACHVADPPATPRRPGLRAVAQRAPPRAVPRPERREMDATIVRRVLQGYCQGTASYSLWLGPAWGAD